MSSKRERRTSAAAAADQYDWTSPGLETGYPPAVADPGQGDIGYGDYPPQNGLPDTIPRTYETQLESSFGRLGIQTTEINGFSNNYSPASTGGGLVNYGQHDPSSYGQYLTGQQVGLDEHCSADDYPGNSGEGGSRSHVPRQEPHKGKGKTKDKDKGGKGKEKGKSKKKDSGQESSRQHTSNRDRLRTGDHHRALDPPEGTSGAQDSLSAAYCPGSVDPGFSGDQVGANAYQDAQSVNPGEADGGLSQGPNVLGWSGASSMYEAGYNAPGPSTAYDEETYSLVENGEEPERPSDGLSAGQQTPTRQFTTTPGYNLLNRPLTVERSSKFKPGSVLITFWAEPAGHNGGGMETVTEAAPPYQGMRRFVVISTREGNSSCVPICTYQNQGCRKPGKKPLYHGIIYDSKSRGPRMLPGEPKLGHKPVAVVMNSGEHLAEASRVNYAKACTIEHNFLVCFIGKVVRKDFENIVLPAAMKHYNGSRP